MRTFREYLGQVRPLVNLRIESVSRRKLKDDQLVKMLLGGKRLRAGLLMMVYEATTGRNVDGVVDLACAVELAHSASLIIDDMLDEDEVRRGSPTMHMTEGHKRAMLDTVGVLSLPYDLAVPFGKDYVQSLAEIQRGMVTGVLKELFHDPDLPASRIYDSIISLKTGRAFGLASSWGYLAGRNGTSARDNETMHSWRDYGVHIGKAMQIADDIADLRQLMTSTKRSLPGSEMILFKCVTAERLAHELFSDIRKLDLHIEKARYLWSSEGSQRALWGKLSAELELAEKPLRTIRIPESSFSSMLSSAPREIADIMLESDAGHMPMRHDVPAIVLPT